MDMKYKELDELFKTGQPAPGVDVAVYLKQTHELKQEAVNHVKKLQADLKKAPILSSFYLRAEIINTQFFIASLEPMIQAFKQAIKDAEEQQLAAAPPSGSVPQ